MKNQKEKGAIVVEATIALTVFIFAIFTLLQIVNICFIQAKMGTALASATKEVSQYSYLYYKFNLNKAEVELGNGTSGARDVTDQTLNGLETLMNEFSDVKSGLDSGDYNSVFQAVSNGTATTKDLVSMYGDTLKDPKAFITGMAKLARSELVNEGKNVLGELMAYSFMQKNLVESPGDDPDSFLKRYHVVDGLKGLDFRYSSLMAFGTSNEIQMVVTYDVEVVKLLNIDVTFTFRQVAKSSAWGNGVSLISPQDITLEIPDKETVWDSLTPVNRGKYITNKEKENLQYTSDRNGFDGYDPANNQFVQIVSLDGASYTENSVKNKLNSDYNSMSGTVSGLGGEITVKDSGGSQVTLPSDPETRTYKLIIVIPDNAPQAVYDGIAKFRQENPGVAVEVKTGYGDSKIHSSSDTSGNS